MPALAIAIAVARAADAPAGPTELDAPHAIVVPVRLPADEPQEQWAQAFGQAGLEAGAPGNGPRARVEDGVLWTVVVVDTRGVEHRQSVPPPADEAAREEVAWLIASLARPTAATAIPTVHTLGEPPGNAPAPRPLPPRPAPGTAWTDPTAVDPPTVDLHGQWVPPASSAQAPSAAAGTLAAVEVHRPSRVGAWALASGGVSVRGDSLAAKGTASGGVSVASLRVGLGFGAQAPAALPGGGSRSFTALDGWLGGWFAPPHPGLIAGGFAGLSRRGYLDGSSEEASSTRTLAGADLGWRFRLGIVQVVPTARLELDPGIHGLRRTVVVVDGIAVGELSPVGWVVGVALGPAPKRADRLSPHDVADSSPAAAGPAPAPPEP